MPPTLTTCTACGCTCDDIRLSVEKDGKVTQAAHACEMGRQWFALPAAAGPAARIDGQQATLDEALARAAEILTQARMPLVAGFRHATTEAVRSAVALADQVGACIDWTGGPADEASTLALQTVGGVTATLGEVAERADVIVVWGADLATTHPRHFERYSLEPASPWISGRQDRHVIVVDRQLTKTCNFADQAVCLAEDADYESLAVLRALVANKVLDAEQVQRQTGVALAVWDGVASRMKAAKFGAVIHGGSLATSRESLVALSELMADLTRHTRWVSVAAGGPGNPTGAAAVLTWQTGYPLGVCLAQSYPQYGPGEWTTRPLLGRGEVDAALIVADDLLPGLSDQAARHLESIPTIAIDSRDTDTWQQAGVAIRTARPGVECAGTTYRVDGVALPLRQARKTNFPAAQSVLDQLCRAVNRQCAS